MRAENLLLFGGSGVGKTHLAAGVARRMVEFGKRVKFFSAIALVQHLQHSKLQVQLQSALKKLVCEASSRRVIALTCWCLTT